MTRLLAAALLLTVAAAPAFACDWNKSASTDTQSRTVASQPTDDHAAPAQGTAKTHKPS